MKNIDFEKSMERISEILKQLDSSEISLDESLKLYEEGAKLIAACTERLQEAEQTVKKISIQSDGSYKEENFQDAEEESK
ncbi:MAG: exodeoxyribonuclease VII small subunit [Clostridiales bacterium]|nr:exodeoxyribonuclease VII small subunit [Clostridiales bacterium]